MGIKVHKANWAKIKGCEIQRCTNGIEVDCADPFILMNKISKCYENGIVTIAKWGILCNGIISFNTILKNKDNGVLIAGKYNFTKLKKNIEIGNNWWAGVKIIEEAMPSLLHNVIWFNFG